MEKKIRNWIYLVLIFELFILNYSCKKDIYPEPTLTDIDGNVYHSVAIGTQLWMAENLKTTKYNDNTAIPNVTENSLWESLGTPGYCWYNNDISNKETYGALYNWYAVNTSKLCPSGWHVPDESDWTILTEYLKGDSIAGGKLKELGNVHWIFPNASATNETRFTALAGGYRNVLSFGNQVHPGGFFIDMRLSGSWWSSSMSAPPLYVWCRRMYFNNSKIQIINNDLPAYGLSMGYSVRCIKD